MYVSKNGIIKRAEEVFESPKFEDIQHSVGMPKVKRIEKNGRIVSEVVFEITPKEERNKGITVDDFALENLIASGLPKHGTGFHGVNFGNVSQIGEAAKVTSAVCNLASLYGLSKSMQVPPVGSEDSKENSDNENSDN